jgi:aspartyl-tRNA(Asn)/glutamyl-tRNA(Gln) amidotransferase subunit A
MAYWALGTDTGGSIRQPAAFCGVVGMKPTYGRVSRHGLMATASSLDQIGTFTQTVEDAAYLLGVIAGEDALDATAAPLPSNKPFEEALTSSVKGVKIGVPKEYFSSELDEDIRASIYKSLDLLKAEGAVIQEVSLPHAKYALPVYYIIQPAEVSSNLARYDGIRYGEQAKLETGRDDISPLWQTYFETRAQYVGTEAKRRVMLGTYALSAGYYDAYYLKAQKVRRLLKEDFEKIFQEVDVLFSPTTPEVAFPAGAKADPISMYLSDIYTVTANLVGIPALSLPIGRKTINGKELPIGGQFMARWFDEETLLSVAHALETSLENNL